MVVGLPRYTWYWLGNSNDSVCKWPAWVASTSLMKLDCNCLQGWCSCNECTSHRCACGLEGQEPVLENIVHHCATATFPCFCCILRPNYVTTLVHFSETGRLRVCCRMTAPCHHRPPSVQRIGQSLASPGAEHFTFWDSFVLGSLDLSSHSCLWYVLNFGLPPARSNGFLQDH